MKKQLETLMTGVEQVLPVNGLEKKLNLDRPLRVKLNMNIMLMWSRNDNHRLAANSKQRETALNLLFRETPKYFCLHRRGLIELLFH